MGGGVEVLEGVGLTVESLEKIETRDCGRQECSGNLGTYAVDIALYLDRMVSVDIVDNEGYEYLQ